MCGVCVCVCVCANWEEKEGRRYDGTVCVCADWKTFLVGYWTRARVLFSVYMCVQAYRVKYIETSSPMPLYHVMGYGFIASYALSWYVHTYTYLLRFRS